jgi:hypothetical protein
MKTNAIFKKKINSGVTIIEILLYFGLVSIFLMVLVDIFAASVNFRLESESASSIQSDSQFILAKMMNDVANSDTLNVSGNTLMLSSGTYSLQNGDLILTSLGVGQKLNGLDTALTSLTFTKLGNLNGIPTVQVKFDIESTIVKQGNIKETRSYQTTLGLR